MIKWGKYIYVCMRRNRREKGGKGGNLRKEPNNMNCEYLEHSVKGGLESMTHGCEMKRLRGKPVCDLHQRPKSYNIPCSKGNIKKQRHHFANNGVYSQSYVLFVCLFVF